MLVAVVLVIAILVVSVSTYTCLAFLGFMRSQAPNMKVMSWMMAGSLDNSNSTADSTIASVIGGKVYDQTVQFYSDYLAMYRGEGLDIRGVHVASGSEISPSMTSAMQDAISLLNHDYGLVISDHCYVHVEIVNGFGCNYFTIYVGMLEVSGSWYVGYAAGVIDLGSL
jgi:hypothetical protein